MRKCILVTLAIIICLSLFAGCTSSYNTANHASSTAKESASSTSMVNASASAVANVSGQLKAHFIDVGQGDSEFIELPDGKTMLIDAGVPEAGGIVVNYIKKLGYSKIDYLVATHPHADHIGGMAKVIDAFDIGSIFMPKASTNTKTFENLLQTIKDKEFTIKTAKAGVQIADGIQILAPVEDKYDDLNQYSAVIRITFGNTHFLFMGDAGKPVELELSGDLSADVLKVGHHGSNTASSPTFIAKVHPQIAIISCAKVNDYGHPHQVTLDTLNAAGVPIYGTYESGTITVVSDGNKVSIDTKPIVKSDASGEALLAIGAAAVVDPKESAAATATVSASPTQSAKATATVAPKPTVTPAPTATPTPKATVAPQSGNGSDIVYITKTGSKFHKDGCSYLSKSKIQTTRAEALTKGLTPCSKCNP